MTYRFPRVEKIVHWTALFVGSLLAMLAIVFFIGEGLLGIPPIHIAWLNAAEKIMFMALGFILIGMAAAWWTPGFGGYVILMGSVMFMVTNSLSRGQLDPGGFFPMIYAIVGLLLILDGYLRRE